MRWNPWKYCVNDTLTVLFGTCRLQTNAVNDAWEKIPDQTVRKKKYKRLKTIIYRCQGPLGNHMLCAELMRFYLVWVCVFFPSSSLWIIHLYLSHLLYHALFFCWCFFSVGLVHSFQSHNAVGNGLQWLARTFPILSIRRFHEWWISLHEHIAYYLSLIPHLDAWSLSKLIFRMSKYFFWTSY